MVKKQKKVVAIVQARCNSIRLPGKVMKKIVGVPVIELLHKRLKKSKEINEIIIATSKNKNNKKLVTFLKKKKLNFFIGEDENVLKRYCDAAIKSKADIIIRITGDSVLIDPKLVDSFIKKFKKKKVDYLSNTLSETFPDGLDIEIFNIKSLRIANKQAKGKYDKEHVTPFIKTSNIFKKYNIKNKIDLSKMRWSLDEEEDFKVIKLIFEKFKPNIHFSWLDTMRLVKKDLKKYSANSFIERN